MKKPQLFLFHFAGGNCYSYNFLLPHLNSFEVICLELPGRGKRMSEPLLTSFEVAAADLAHQITLRIKDHSDFFFYGHSMGAVLALKVAELMTSKKCPPAYLFVSGNAGPGTSERKNIHLLERDQFFLEIKNLGGLPDDLLVNNELLDFFEPILRADFQVADGSDSIKELCVNIPVYALMGSEEESSSMISNWARYSTAIMEYEILDGNHFFIHKYPKKIARVIEKHYGKNTLLQS